MGAACVGLERLSQPVAEAAPIVNPTHIVPYAGNGPWYVCNADGVGVQRVASAGPASLEMCPAVTLVELLRKAAGNHGDQPALKVERPVPELEDGRSPPALPEAEWLTWTWAQYLDDVQNIAKACIKVGFKQYDSLNVWGFNAPEWMIAAYAAGFAGGKVAGLYPTDTDETAAYKVAHSGGSIIIIEDRGKLKKLQSGLTARYNSGVYGDGRKVKAIVAYGFKPAAGETLELHGAGAVPIYGWQEFLQIGKGESDAEMDKRVSSSQAGNCAALIYTSGTTGDPKAVMISHDNINFEAFAVMESVKKAAGYGTSAVQERFLSYLPLSHVAGMMIDIVSPVVLTSGTKAWCTGYFARPYDLKVGAIKDRLQVARPTLFLGVPLVWEKIADKIRAIGASSTGLKKFLGDWAKGVNLDYTKGAQLGAQPGSALGQAVAKKIMNAVKENLGLDKCKYAFTGAAPIRVDTLEYFGSLDLPIYEAYGMSECTGAATWSLPRTHQWGSCGFELPGTEVKVFLCDEKDLNKKVECERSPGMDITDEKYQGEVCFRGRHIMMGYLAQYELGRAHVAEIEQKTAECIDKQGWLHSGDKGMMTVSGMLKITGRYKELIIGEGGENIAPIPIEDHVKKMCDGIAEIMMVGDKRKYNVALITLKAFGANGEVPGTDNLDAGAARINPEVKTITDARKDQVWIEKLTAAITSANNNGKVCSNNAAKIQKFTILDTNFSEQNGELTPTKKLKRKVVEGIYKDVIERLYKSGAKDVYIPF